MEEGTLKKHLENLLRIKLRDREFTGGHELFRGEDKTIKDSIRENFSADNGFLQNIPRDKNILNEAVINFYEGRGYKFAFGFSELHDVACVSTHYFFKNNTTLVGVQITHEGTTPNILGTVSYLPPTIDFSMETVEAVHQIQALRQ